AYELHLYPLNKAFTGLSRPYPKAIHQRYHPDLLARLQLDDIPILFEGLASTYYLTHGDLRRRKCLVRLPRVEWRHEQRLTHFDRGLDRQYAQSREAKRWQKFEATLGAADHLLVMSESHKTYYEGIGPCSLIPPFHGHRRVSSSLGRGDYFLFHGDLSRPDVHAAAMFLVQQIFSDLSMIPLVIAGDHPGPELISVISNFEHITLKPEPGRGELAEMLHQAHGHVLPSFAAGPISHRLINALFMGRFVVVNPDMVGGTGLAFGTDLAQDPDEMKRLIFDLWHRAFTEIDLAQRKAAIGGSYDDQANAKKIIEILRQK
ncbi:MAG: hypothetical protein AAF804_16080, partial [Bacteroidota bacterium]